MVDLQAFACPSTELNAVIPIPPALPTKLEELVSAATAARRWDTSTATTMAATLALVPVGRSMVEVKAAMADSWSITWLSDTCAGRGV